MKKLNLVMCFFGLLGTLTFTGCSSTSSDNGGNGNTGYSYSKTSYYSYYKSTSSYSYYTPASSSSYVSDKQKVINHLKTYGTGSYYKVSTGDYTTLSYDTSSGYFNTDCTVISGSLTLYLVTASSFNDTKLGVSMGIYDGSTKKFLATWLVNVSNHEYDSLVSGSMEVEINKYSSSYTSTISKYMLSMTILAINNASSYLSSKGLPYIY